MLAKLLVIFVLTTSNTEAALEKGNGGDVLVCGDKVELLDYYNAEKFLGLTVSLPGNLEDEKDIVLKTIERLRDFDPYRVREYLETLSAMEKSWIATPASYEDIKDYEDIGIPAGCSVQQAIVQRIPRFGLEKRYLVNSELWAKLPARDKAGLVLHELILAEAIALKQEDARATRYFNAILSSQNLRKDHREYLRVLADVGFGFRVSGQFLDLKGSLRFDERGMLCEGSMTTRCSGAACVTAGPEAFQSWSTYVEENQKNDFYLRGRVELYPNLNFKAIQVLGPGHFIQDRLRVDYENLAWIGLQKSDLRNYAGEVKVESASQMNNVSGSLLRFAVGDRTVHARWIQFRRDGSIEKALTGGFEEWEDPSTVIMVNGTVVEVAPCHSIEYNDLPYYLPNSKRVTKITPVKNCIP